MKLLLIADDFTGALDTGIQFAEYGADAKMVMSPDVEEELTGKAGPQVLIVDLETRHKTPAEAYRAVYDLVFRARAAGVPYIYKKTDSGLRGNIGKELRAVLDASKERFLPFVPALPDMNRVTVNGMQYIDGLPIDESVFGEDLYEPVQSPYVWDLFRKDDIPLKLFPVAQSYETDVVRSTIGIFDAERQEDIRCIVQHLKEKGQLSVMAGCAGLAAVLPEFLQIEKRITNPPVLFPPLLVACGSINPITRRQIEYGESVGYKRIILSPKQQLEEGYLETEEGEKWFGQLEQTVLIHKVVMLDTGISSPELVGEYIKERQIPLEEARVRISESIGKILKKYMEHKQTGTIMVIGGDTLKGFVDQVNCKGITPVCQVEQGTVLSAVDAADHKFWVISKSGGFGSENLLQTVAERVKERGSKDIDRSWI